MNRRPRLGVLVPCRNEAAVIARKLRNLAQSQWPPSDDGPHQVVIVDDGSEDDTGSIAHEQIAQLFGDGPTPSARDAGATATMTVQSPDSSRPRVCVVLNEVRPGKAGAITQGLEQLGDQVDIVLLSDADVVLRPDALRLMSEAFAEDPLLGMACGSQEFVRDLSEDGTPRAADGTEPTPAPSRYDRWTALVRAFESRSGRLFSVHGQLLAWRADLGLAPTPGIAADDIDLMVQVRARGAKVRMLDAARFLEVKTPPGPGREAQEVRRARAYVQVIRHCALPPASPRLDRVQFALYRSLPLAAPWIALALGVSLTLWGVALLPRAGGVALLAGLLGLVVSPPGRRGIRLAGVIARATRVESAGSLGDRWEMDRISPGNP